MLQSWRWEKKQSRAMRMRETLKATLAFFPVAARAPLARSKSLHFLEATIGEVQSRLRESSSSCPRESDDDGQGHLLRQESHDSRAYVALRRSFVDALFSAVTTYALLVKRVTKLPAN